MKVSEAAKILNTPVKDLIESLIQKVPSVDWKKDTELPQEFVDQLNLHSQEYQQVAGLPKQESQNAIEAIKDSRIVLESLEYAILESLADERTYQLLIESANQAVDDFQQSEVVYTEVISQLANQKLQRLKERRRQIEEKYSNSAMGRSKALGELQGKLVVQSHQLQESRQNSQNLSNDFIAAALGLK